jgi:glycosyltransferase involved in cell wall biosynthesis
MVARRLRIPCIWYVQEEVDEKRGAGLFRYILIKGAQSIPTKLMVDAAALLEQFGNESALRDTVEVVYNGIDTAQFAPFSKQEQQEARGKFNVPKNATVLGQAGRIIPLKGQATLLQAFADLAQGFPDLHLLFVGAPLFGSQDYIQKLKSQAAQWGLAERVHFSGFIPDVRQGLAAMDIFIHASVETDSPLSVMEAMSCSLPVVVSGVRGTIEMVESEVNALIFEPGNSDALALMLGKLLISQQMQKELGRQARATVMEKFSLQASVTQLESLIEKVYAA